VRCTVRPTGKDLAPHKRGERLVAEGEELVGQYERVVEIIREYRTANRGYVRIGAGTTPGYYLLPAVLGRFHQAHPDVEIHYSVENSLSIEGGIVRNDLDIGVVGGHLAREDLYMEQVADDEIVCFCGPEHRLAKARRVSVNSLHHETWVIRERGSATRDQFERWLESVGGEMTATIELTTPEGIKALVGAGLGISFLSIHAIRGELKQKSLRVMPVAGLKLTRPIYLIMHPEKHLSPVLGELRDMIRDGLRGAANNS